MKKTVKSSDFDIIISSIAHKSLINTELSIEVDQFFHYFDLNNDELISTKEIEYF
jgi:hypothetical protein